MADGHSLLLSFAKSRWRTIQRRRSSGRSCMAGRIDVFILLTGVGATALFDLLKTRYPWASIVEALKGTAIIARGPKPVATLKAVGLQATVTVPEPNTWVDLIFALDKYRSVDGLRVAVQEYGVVEPRTVARIGTARRGGIAGSDL